MSDGRLFFFFLFFQSSGGWVKIKLKLPHFHVSDTCRVSSCFDLTHAAAATARAAATGPVSMSTRPDPEASDTVEIRCSHPEMSSSPGSVRIARAHQLTKTQAMEPSRQTWSSYGPPYPLGRWSSPSPWCTYHILYQVCILDCLVMASTDDVVTAHYNTCLLYTSPSPRDRG